MIPTTNIVASVIKTEDVKNKLKAMMGIGAAFLHFTDEGYDVVDSVSMVTVTNISMTEAQLDSVSHAKRYGYMDRQAAMQFLYFMGEIHAGLYIMEN